MLPISFCTFVKNEESNIIGCIESVRPIVSEIVIVDTGSTDNTLEIAKRYTDRVYQIPFTDFGTIRTITAHLASQPWVLLLDADERLEPNWDLLAKLIDQPEGVPQYGYERDSSGVPIIDSWALPRKRWADKWMTEQVDVESYPDWQVRLIRNHSIRRKIRYVRRVHETVDRCIRTEHSEEGPVINHVQNLHKDRDALLNRQRLYTTLYNEDIADGVVHHEPPVIEEDKVE